MFTNSWAIANGLTTWLPIWYKNVWKIRYKQSWGTEIWKHICEMLKCTNVSVFHIDAHSWRDTLEHEYNTTVDNLAKIKYVRSAAMYR